MPMGIHGKLPRVALVLAAAMLLSGCTEEKRKSRELDVTGTVESVDLANRTVEVSTFIEKLGSEQKFSVRVTPDTEILIDGALAKLEDVRVGERARGDISVETEGNKKVYVAIQVSIERGETIVSPASKAASEEDTATNG